jgi:hypothetical protein
MSGSALCVVCGHKHPGKACNQCFCAAHVSKHPQKKKPLEQRRKARRATRRKS